MDLVLTEGYTTVNCVRANKTVYVKQWEMLAV